MNRYWQIADPSYWERVRQAMIDGWKCDTAFRNACADVGLDWQKAIAAPIDNLVDRQTTRRNPVRTSGRFGRQNG